MSSGYLSHLLEQSKEQLVNDIYNDRVGALADFEDEHKKFDDTGTGKRIPYIGWFWRHTDFVNKRISIGNTGRYVGVMENNKWGYPERLMTEEEATKFIEYLEAAFAELNKYNSSTSRANAERVFADMRAWFQSLDVR